MSLLLLFHGAATTPAAAVQQQGGYNDTKPPRPRIIVELPAPTHATATLTLPQLQITARVLGDDEETIIEALGL